MKTIYNTITALTSTVNIQCFKSPHHQDLYPYFSHCLQIEYTRLLYCEGIATRWRQTTRQSAEALYDLVNNSVQFTAALLPGSPESSQREHQGHDGDPSILSFAWQPVLGTVLVLDASHFFSHEEFLDFMVFSTVSHETLWAFSKSCPSSNFIIIVSVAKIKV